MVENVHVLHVDATSDRSLSSITSSRLYNVDTLFTDVWPYSGHVEIATSSKLLLGPPGIHGDLECYVDLHVHLRTVVVSGCSTCVYVYCVYL